MLWENRCWVQTTRSYSFPLQLPGTTNPQPVIRVWYQCGRMLRGCSKKPSKQQKWAHMLLESVFSTYMPLGPLVPVKRRSEEKTAPVLTFLHDKHPEHRAAAFKMGGKGDCWARLVDRRFPDRKRQMVDFYRSPPPPELLMMPASAREHAGNAGCMLGVLVGVRLRQAPSELLLLQHTKLTKSS